MNGNGDAETARQDEAGQEQPVAEDQGGRVFEFPQQASEMGDTAMKHIVVLTPAQVAEQERPLSDPYLDRSRLSIIDASWKDLKQSRNWKGN